MPALEVLRLWGSTDRDIAAGRVLDEVSTAVGGVEGRLRWWMEKHCSGMSWALWRLLGLLGHGLSLGSHNIPLGHCLRLIIHWSCRHDRVIELRLRSGWEIILLTSVGVHEDLGLRVISLRGVGEFPSSHDWRGHGYRGLMRGEVISRWGRGISSWDIGGRVLGLGVVPVRV